MVDYDAAKANATRLLSENGRTVQIVAAGAATGPDYDPTPGVDIITEVTAVFTGFKTGEMDGTIIRVLDKKVLIDADDLQAAVDAGGPIEQQKLRDGGVNYSIFVIDKIEPGPVDIMSKLRCRV